MNESPFGGEGFKVWQLKKKKKRTVIRHGHGYKLLQWIDTNITFFFF